MKIGLRFSVLAVAAAVAASSASATPTGFFSIANITNGGVIVSATGIDFYPPANPSASGIGDFATGGFTNISYGSGSTLTAVSAPYGQIKDISTGTAGTVANFIQFYAGLTLPVPAGTGSLVPAPVFDLTGLIAGGTNQGALNNCAGVMQIGVSCSPVVTVGGNTFISPFVLTNRGAYTNVSLGMNLLGRDGVGPNSAWQGGFTAQVVNLTPDMIQTMFNSGQTINNTISGTFTGTPIPEPATFALMGSALAVAGAVRRLRRPPCKATDFD